ncbi:MAG TPA: uroporphyrinogen-III C-methyltransferase [Niabella sp.]|nr:uroporphyrinogen-III C-methyltransferase [Niabella sp.]HOZ96766.1 uroporphyrinogen-III C-methyltransferase [Niabella sp.]HQW14757.1 uroporphyrinogen-III C-methyltransferase [Niabella sp.]HQX19991.1 uroporphyrinogen-III C-methyltransferase [Niabella sp.]HQX40611.1 uroporphyrinogen-III C-methyltransferase [Niabella sp.]
MSTSHQNSLNIPPEIKQRMGKVVFAAAGSGDPDLITVKAANALREAEVVLVDRLVSREIIKRYVSANAIVVKVGKECKNDVSTPQLVINQLLVQNALDGKLVVRLKGGDVSVFSNILDELQSVMAHQIPYEIIPGVTASLGAAAYAGIPLTARGYAKSLRMLTHYKSDIVSDEKWQELAQTDDTLVFYMSSSNLDDMVDKLLEFGISKKVHIAIVEQATTICQQVHECNIYEYGQQLKGKKFISPSLVIIGKVVALHRQYKWLENSDHQEKYFISVGESAQNILENTKPREHVI